MNVKLKFEGFEPTEEQLNLLESYISFLKQKHPFKDDVEIHFVMERVGNMTTGQKSKDGVIFILVKDRLNRDVLKTLSHEWVHIYQTSVLKRKNTGDVGGKNEDEANAKSGEDIKRFEYNNPKEEDIIYKPFQTKIEEITNRLNSESPKKLDIISEIKNISIDKLPYEYDSLDKFIDKETMNVHYNKHYKGYVKKLNQELDKIKGKDLDLEQLIKTISKFNQKVKNNGGGAFNHALFWKMLSPKPNKIGEDTLTLIKKHFGSFEDFKTEFEEMAKNNFGSGWVWLILTKNNKLKIVTTANQNNPLMNDEPIQGYPILGLDLWEHAYYLRYKNKRDEYISNFWKVVNWGFVEDQLTTRINMNKTK